MADQKQAQREEAQEKETTHEDLELPQETADQVKGGTDGWDLKQNKSV